MGIIIKKRGQSGTGIRISIENNGKNRQSRNKPSPLWSTDFQQGCKDHAGRKRTGMWLCT